jgi:alkylation response protein AidB-like acyl-CoA dehydrogenase
MATDVSSPAGAARGGSFLIEDRSPGEVFTPEDFTDEQVMIGATAAEYVESEVVPRLAQLNRLDYELSRELLRKAGELGLLSVELPEPYGLGLDKVTGSLVAEKMGRDGGFATSFGVQTGIGTLPIVYFGTEAQRQKYLPKLATGEWVSSYSLSESSSASDALNAKARAVLSPDGKSWILDGEKMWLSNAGFADLYITFAKVDGEHFTAFIVEKGMPGVSLGPEERKVGIKSSSTRPLVLADAVVPRENLLGEVGKGHKIAFGCLNIGRFKLGAMVTGGVKYAIAAAAGYAMSRTAFGRPIAEFGLIQHKLGQMAILDYVAEAIVYRTAGMIDARLADLPPGDTAAALRVIEDYDAECSIVKVWCSEMCNYVVDETVQIFGGAGYVEDYPAERIWRDARINRIYEGTSEINRLLVTGRLLRKAMKGELPLFEKALELQAELTAPEAETPAPQGFLAAEAAMVGSGKKVALASLGLAAQVRGEALKEDQEVMGHFADIAMAVYSLESAILRARKRAAARGEDASRLQEAAVRCYAQDAMDIVEASARRLLAAIADGEDLELLLGALRRLTRRATCNVVALRRQVAQAVIEKGGYPLG